MFFRHSTDKLIYPLLALFILVVISYRPAYRLRTDMPQIFFASNAPCGPKRPIEQKIACAYWDSAQMNLQWQYPKGHPLPVEIPADFAIDAPALGPTASASATRELYWHRLQIAWNLPESWKQTYEWNWSWGRDPLNSAAEWLKETMARLFTIK